MINELQGWKKYLKAPSAKTSSSSAPR